MAAAVAIGVMIGLWLIPIVHFFTILPSPFIGGYVGGSKVQATPNAAMTIGALMAAVPLAMLLALGALLGHSFLYAIGIVVALYVAGLGALGALIAGNSARSEAAESG